MDRLNDILLKYDARVPRYTSYPTAPHFGEAVNAGVYRHWLAGIPAETPLSLYLHVPFCSQLCWFCGCQMSVVNRYQPVASYLDLLAAEIDLVVAALGPGRPVSHVHWGGGSPDIVKSADFAAVMAHLGRHFAFADGAEVAVEIDPRIFTPEQATAMAAAGVNRASLGVQDFAAEVQAAINRIQPFEQTAATVAALRQAGIDDLSFDLLYGLPRQTAASLVATVDQALELEPDRISLFGYAHVPWMRKHQALMDESALPGAAARLELYQAASGRLVERGFSAIGIDHFARPGDDLGKAGESGRLHRNFQGYTTDPADILIGLGASAIGALPQGYVQNATQVPDYRRAIEAGRLATVRGLELNADDRLRRDVIERLMCDLSVDLGAVSARHGGDPAIFSEALVALEPMRRDGLVTISGDRVTVAPAGRTVVRLACAAFDRYLAQGKARHSSAI